jgi:hypothetical protein
MCPYFTAIIGESLRLAEAEGLRGDDGDAAGTTRSLSRHGPKPAPRFPR